MIDEHQGQCIYENGRFRLREETDYAIIDELKDFPPIMVQMEETDDGSESQYADRRGVLHLLNQLADTNPNEQRHFYLKYRLDKVHDDNDLLRKENEQLKEENQELRQDNDIKFWKLQYMRQHNSTQLIVHEVSLAIKQGYEVSDEFKKYIDDLKENNKKMMEKNKRLFGDVE